MKVSVFSFLFLLLPVFVFAQEGIDPKDILKFEDLRNVLELTDNIDQPYKILEYNIMIKPNDSKLHLANVDFYESEEEQYSSFELLHTLESGNRVWFDNVKIEMEDGTRKTVSMSFKVADDGLLYRYVEEK